MQWRSYELRPAGTTISEAYKQRILAARPRFNQLALDQYGIEINNGPFGIDSRPALIGAKFADQQGHGEVFHENVMHAYWRDARDVSDLAVLEDVAVQSGIDSAEFQTALTDPAINGLVSADIEFAFNNGISGVPALVFDNKYLVSGAQPYERLTQITEQVLARRSQ